MLRVLGRRRCFPVQKAGFNLRKGSPAALALLEHIKSNKAQIIEEDFSWQKSILPT